MVLASNGFRDGVVFNEVEPGGLGGGFFFALIIFLVFQRLDLIYFPAKAEIRKMQEQLKKGQRPTRPPLKRLFFGACWLLPVVGLCQIALWIGARVVR